MACGSDFSDIDQVIAEAQAAQLLAVVDIPALHPATLQRIDKLGLSFWSAINLKSADGAQLSMMERQRTKVWLRKASQSIDAALQQL
ncbi:hypothetical protein UMZ34_07895 [Halopseudomonas pachastrellae]|nr:hypothetical protein UMZ34_07895 [Halopseudomonas pachastrellae]